MFLISSKLTSKHYEKNHFSIINLLSNLRMC